MFRQQWRSSKWRAVRTVCLSDHKHDSKFESGVCDELRLRKIAGDIKDFQTQVRVPFLWEGLTIWNFICDFLVTHKDGTLEYIEAKGMEFLPFRKKWNVIQKQFAHDPNVRFTLIKQRGMYRG